jgi:hypothetical protein
MVDRRLHDDPRKIYLHLKAPRLDLHRPTNHTPGRNWDTHEQLEFRVRAAQDARNRREEQVKAAIIAARQESAGLSKDGKTECVEDSARAGSAFCCNQGLAIRALRSPLQSCNQGVTELQLGRYRAAIRALQSCNQGVTELQLGHYTAHEKKNGSRRRFRRYSHYLSEFFSLSSLSLIFGPALPRISDNDDNENDGNEAALRPCLASS